MRPARSAAAASLVFLGLAACETPAPPMRDAGPPPSASTAPVVATAPTAPLPRCRVIMAEGSVSPRSDPTTWLTMDERTSFVVRFTETARELRFVGPGRVLACGDDAVVLASGTLLAMPSGGETPGDGIWVATPCGAARFVSGTHKIEAHGRACMVQASIGSLFFTPSLGEEQRPLPLGDAGATGSISAEGRRTHRIDGRFAVEVTAKHDTRHAEEDCREATAREADVAARIRALDAGGLAALGPLTAEDVELRRLARASCLVVRARRARDEAGDAGAFGR